MINVIICRNESWIDDGLVEIRACSTIQSTVSNKYKLFSYIISVIYVLLTAVADDVTVTVTVQFLMARLTFPLPHRPLRLELIKPNQPADFYKQILGTGKSKAGTHGIKLGKLQRENDLADEVLAGDLPGRVQLGC